MTDENIAKDQENAVYENDTELKKSTPPTTSGRWVWFVGFLSILTGMALGLLMDSFQFFFGMFCFSLIFFAISTVIDKLNEILTELKRK